VNEQTLDQLQRAAFGYFLRTVNPTNGLIADTSRENSPCSIAVVGFALSAYPVAVERRWMARSDAVERTLAVLRFFRDSDQSGSPEATGYNGFYYHFLSIETAARVALRAVHNRHHIPARRRPHGRRVFRSPHGAGAAGSLVGETSIRTHTCACAERTTSRTAGARPTCSRRTPSAIRAGSPCTASGTD